MQNNFYYFYIQTLKRAIKQVGLVKQIMKLIKYLFPIILIALIVSCSNNKGVVEPQASPPQFSNTGKWIEIVQVDSSGRERVDGNYRVENTLEFFDTTYEFTSKTIQLEDSTNIFDDHFSLHHWGKFRSRNDTLTIYTSDRIYMNTLKTLISEDTLRMGGILRCTLEEPANVYSCIGAVRYPYDEYPPLGLMGSFLWDKFYSKRTATFTKK